MSGLTSFRNVLDREVAHVISFFGLVNCLGDSFQRANLSDSGFLDWMKLCQYNCMFDSSVQIRYLASSAALIVDLMWLWRISTVTAHMQNLLSYFCVRESLVNALLL